MREAGNTINAINIEAISATESTENSSRRFSARTDRKNIRLHAPFQQIITLYEVGAAVMRYTRIIGAVICRPQGVGF